MRNVQRTWGVVKPLNKPQNALLAFGASTGPFIFIVKRLCYTQR